MKKFGLLAVSVSAGLVCAAVPASLSWSPANVTLFSLDTAEARVGRPLTATSVAGVNRRMDRRAYRRGEVGTGVVAAGAYVGAAAAASYYGSAPAASYYGSGPAASYYGSGPAVTDGGSGYGYGPGPSSYVTVDPVTGRQCTIEPSGWHWCWRP